MLIPNSTTGISHYMGNKSQYAIKQSCSIRMESSVLRRRRHYETSVRTLQDKEKPFIQKGKFIHSWTGIIVRSCNMNASSHIGFLLVLEMTSSSTCKDLHNNIVSVIHLIELATAESNTHMCYSIVSWSSQIDSKTPALATRQHNNSLMPSKECSCCEMNG